MALQIQRETRALEKRGTENGRGYPTPRFPISYFLFPILLLFPVAAHAQVHTAATDPDAAVEAGGETVDTFVLTPAYPNPFNPSTQFTLTVAEDQQVLIEVYSLLGRRVDVLHDGPLAAQQRHTFTFEAGTTIPNGLYLIRVTGEHFTATQRVTLLK